MFGCEIEFQEKTGNLAIVDVRPAALGEDGGYALEISKYLSKSNDFLQLPPDELLNAERIIRGKRLITSIGICNKFRGKSNSLLDNQNTNDGEVVSPSSAISSKLLNIFELPKSREIIEKPDSIREIGRKFYENGQKTEWLEFVDTLYKFQVETARDNFLLRFPSAIVTDIRGGVFYGENVRPTKIREDLTVTFARIIKNTNKNIRRTKNYGN
jgi:hypothetical protein